MKRIISLLLALTLCLSLCACGNGEDPTETTEATTETTEATTEATTAPTETEPVETIPPVETTEPTPLSYWTTEYTVDDFGDPTDEAIIKSVIAGKFSNTATTGSDLTVVVYLLPDTSELTFGFKLLEYGDQPATFIGSDDMVLKTKIGETIKEYDLIGADGTVFTTDYVGWDFVNLLINNNDIRCVIEIGSSKYSFTIEGEGFHEELKPFTSN